MNDNFCLRSKSSMGSLLRFSFIMISLNYMDHTGHVAVGNVSDGYCRLLEV